MSDEPLEVVFPPGLRDRFDPLKTLGAGSMGAVYLVRDRELDREVAIKVISGSSPSKEMVERFRREAAALAKIRHPHVLQVYDHGVGPDGPWMTMEFLDCVPLAESKDDAPPLEVMLQAADGLEEIHRNGLVHRDLKPDNIVWADGERAVIVDFGLVLDPKRTKITRQGAVVGTVAYMAPEVLRLKPLSPACDWYSWGVTLFKLAEGRIPFNLVEVMNVAKGQPLPDLEFERLDPTGGTAALLRRALAERPEQRPVTLSACKTILAEARSLRSEPHDPERSEVTEARKAILVADDEATEPVAPGLESARLDPPSVETTQRQLRLPRQRAGVAAAAMAATFVLGWVASRPGPTPSATGAASEPLPQDLARTTLDDLAAASDEYMDAWGGAASRADQQLANRDVRPVLDPDPARWGLLTRKVAGLRRFHLWLAEGGRPERIDPGLRQALLELDAVVTGKGLTSPFRPWLDSGPAVPGPLPELLRSPAFAERELPDPVDGWLRTSLASLDEAARRQLLLDQRLREGGDDLPPRLVSTHETLGTGIWASVRALWDEREPRTAIAPLLAEGNRALVRAYYAAAREMRARPEGAERLAAVFVADWPMLATFYYSPAMHLEPEVLLGGPPRTPAEAYLAIRLVDVMRIVRRRAGQAPGLDERLVEWCELASGPGTEDSPHARLRRDDALVMYIRVLKELGRVDDLYALTQRSGEAIDGAAEDRRAWMDLNLLEAAAQAEGRFLPAELAAIRARLRGSLGQLTEAGRRRAEAVLGEG